VKVVEELCGKTGKNCIADLRSGSKAPEQTSLRGFKKENGPDFKRKHSEIYSAGATNAKSTD